MTDLAMGQEPEKAVRATLLATELARMMDLAEAEVAEVYYLTLLRHLGCTAPSHEEAYLFGGDVSDRALAERTDDKRPREAMALMRTVGRGTGPRRLQHIGRVVAGQKRVRAMLRSVCEVGSRMAERLGFGGAVSTGLSQVMERWDGRGAPHGESGDGIVLPLRLAEVATQSVAFDRLGGPDAALEMVRRRAGGWFDPQVAEEFERRGPEILRKVEASDPWQAVLDAEPEPVRRVAEEGLDELARAFADMTDLHSSFTLEHSSGVSELAEAAAHGLGFTDRDVTALRRAALFHDLGRPAVSTATWEKPGPLTAAEWERVRLHPYHTERILARSPVLESVARLAGMHHERQDGSGYHHGAAGPGVPAGARLLGAADAFQAMTQERSHRPAFRPEEAAEKLLEAAGSGVLDPECARAVVEAAGQRPVRVRTTWPAGLTDREVEVLRLVARGSSNRGVAEELFISPRTAEHHVQHIYDKIGVSTRAAAAMFAMEHGLLRD
jgi:putative nucleotidyltransferase with HDIG domain